MRQLGSLIRSLHARAATQPLLSLCVSPLTDGRPALDTVQRWRMLNARPRLTSNLYSNRDSAGSAKSAMQQSWSRRCARASELDS